MALRSFIPASLQTAQDFSPEYIMLCAENALHASPDFHDVLANHNSAYLSSGPHLQRRAGSGTEFWQYREYRDGDAAHTVDWRKSARSDTHYVREREWEKAQTVSLWLSNAPDMQFKHKKSAHSKYHYGAILTYIAAAKFLHAGERLSLLGSPIQNRQSAASLHELSAYLAHQDVTDKTTEQSALKTAQHSIPILLADFWDEPAALDKQLAALNAQNHTGLLIQIVDPAELSLPYKGRVLLDYIGEKSSDDLSTSKFTINKIENTRAEYCARIKDHCDAIAAVAAKQGYRSLCISTDTDFAEATRAIYTALAAHKQIKGR